MVYQCGKINSSRASPPEADRSPVVRSLLHNNVATGFGLGLVSLQTGSGRAWRATLTARSVAGKGACFSLHAAGTGPVVTFPAGITTLCNRRARGASNPGRSATICASIALLRTIGFLITAVEKLLSGEVLIFLSDRVTSRRSADVSH